MNCLRVVRHCSTLTLLQAMLIQLLTFWVHMAALEVAVAASGSPYPDFARPYPEECREVRNRLAELHGFGVYARGNQCPSIDPPQVSGLEQCPQLRECTSLSERCRLQENDV